MKLADAIKKSRQIQATMEQRATESSVAAQRYTGHMALYTAAANSNDVDGMMLERDALHACIDVILDNGAMIGSLNLELAHIRQNIDDEI